MNAENFSIDDSAQDEEVEYLTAGFPDGGVAVFLLTFFIESVDLGDLAGFVVAPDEGDTVGVSRVMLVSRGCSRRARAAGRM